MQGSDRFYRVPCFPESSEILMSNGNLYVAEDISINDEVLTPFGPSKVFLIVETTLTEPTEMIKIDSLVITPAHPIKFQNKWILPTQHPRHTKLMMNNCKVYSFALERHHSMIVNEIEVIGLGHEFKDPILKGSYLGSRKIIENLFLLADLNRVVKFNSGDFLIDKKTGTAVIHPDYYQKKIEENEEISFDLVLNNFQLIE